MAGDLREGPEIAVVGSANLDLVVEVATIPVPGETVLGGDLRRIPGGKGANQAVAAARLGRRVAMVGRVGDDDAGTTLRSAMDAAGVDTTWLLNTDATPSGTALIAVAADGDNAIVVSPGANGRVSSADVASSAGVLGAAAVVLLQLEVPLEAVAAAVRHARGMVVLNPAPAPTAMLPDDLLDGVDVIVPNQTELATLAGYTGLSAIGEVDPDTAVALARGLPVAAAVVTLGAAGAMVVTPADATHVPAPAVEPVDTTAAGDAFCGALADALVDGADLVGATEWAVRVGAAATLRPGAQPSLPTAAEVDRLLGA
ncbi:MAG: ribokinase [Acidimicrobiaceae bacterium]|nr:ribokinase [Acidimicrobiaceae bacterium]MYG98917.1 ribokinase [Acidimicrobiaceae bacterium]MYL04198.1 ribokinase [Acidimicrobiaceae bacterium]